MTKDSIVLEALDCFLFAACKWVMACCLSFVTAFVVILGGLNCPVTGYPTSHYCKFSQAAPIVFLYL